jgi:hypothetical protein
LRVIANEAKAKGRIIIFAGLGIIALIISFVAYLQLENARVQAYRQLYARIVAASRTLTQSYQSEIGKWKSKQYDNNTMISITDHYLPKFQSLIKTTKELQPPSEKYVKSRDFSVQSFESELESYRHFRNYLVTRNTAEDNKSSQLLSDALKYETYAFAAFNSAH